jgi:TPR repeat protein
VLGGVMIALAGFAYVQWASLRTGIASPGRVVTPRVAATAPRTPLGKNPSAAVQRPSEAIPSAAQSSDPGPMASSSTAPGPSAPGPSAPGPSAPKASAAERADTGNTVGAPEPRNTRDQGTLTAGIPPATEKSEKSWSPRAMPAPNAVESGDSGLNSGMNGGTNELRLAQRYLGGSMGARDSAEAAKLLWKAVRQQNATAALMLSDLYAHGDGVPRSCDQARLLLLAAAKRGAPQAAEQLRSLQSRGCR